MAAPGARYCAMNSVAGCSRTTRGRWVTVAELIRDAGGIRPPRVCRSEVCLSLTEREEISRGLAAGDSLRAIAARLGVRRRR